MITVGMDYRVRPGKESDFEQAFRSVLAALADAQGHLESHLYRDIDSAQTYLIVSEWEEEKAFQLFLQSEAFREAVKKGREELLADRPRHRVFHS